MQEVLGIIKNYIFLQQTWMKYFYQGLFQPTRKKKKKKKYHILMKILERRTHEISSKIHQFVKDLD